MNDDDTKCEGDCSNKIREKWCCCWNRTGHRQHGHDCDLHTRRRRLFVDISGGGGEEIEE